MAGSKGKEKGTALICMEQLRYRVGVRNTDVETNAFNMDTRTTEMVYVKMPLNTQCFHICFLPHRVAIKALQTSLSERSDKGTFLHFFLPSLLSS